MNSSIDQLGFDVILWNNEHATEEIRSKSPDRVFETTGVKNLRTSLYHCPGFLELFRSLLVSSVIIDQRFREKLAVRRSTLVYDRSTKERSRAKQQTDVRSISRRVGYRSKSESSERRIHPLNWLL